MNSVTRIWTSWQSVAARFVVATVAVFLLFSPYISNSLRDLTRYLYMWQRQDMAVLLGMIIALAVLATLIDGVMRRLGRPALTRLYHHWFVLVLGAGILANVAFYNARSAGWHIGRTGMEMQTLWLILAAIVAYSFARPTSRLVPWCRRACLIVSPAVPIVAFQLLTAPTYPKAADRLAPVPVVPVTDKAPAVRERPVYLFVFDEWSYERTFTEGSIPGSLSNLSALAAQSVVFHDAHSPGEDTARSMPGLLFQTGMRPTIRDGQVGFDRDARIAPTSKFDCLFNATGRLGYRRIMIGAFLPYAAWLGDQVDVCRSYCYYPEAESLVGRTAVHAFNVVSYLTDPWSVLACDKLRTRANDRQILKVHERASEDIFSVLRDQPAATFAVVHYLLPHEPFFLNPDGSYRGPDESAWVRSNTEGYMRNLACLDGFIGQIVQVMRESGRFDDALLIVTSDHSWRFDPARKTGKVKSPLTHVPLLVKLPGQHESVSVTERFETRTLGSLIRWGLGPDATPSGIDRWMPQRQTSAALVEPWERWQAGE
jgi:hypothetical protein